LDDSARPRDARQDLSARERHLGRLPFGGGRRICIGNHFALTEGQIILNSIARQFSMEPASSRPLRFEPMITLRPKGGVPVILRKSPV